MAEYTEKRTPYEFLARWNENGNLAGAHVGFITRTYKDGVLIAAQPDSVQPVAIGGMAGFPLAELLDQTTIDALAALDLTRAECEAQIAAIQAAHAEEIAALKAKIQTEAAP